MRGILVLDEVLQTPVDLLHQEFDFSRCLVSLLARQQHPQFRYASLATANRHQLAKIVIYLNIIKQQVIRYL